MNDAEIDHLTYVFDYKLAKSMTECN
jgi:hypothetical protein